MMSLPLQERRAWLSYENFAAQGVLPRWSCVLRALSTSPHHTSVASAFRTSDWDKPNCRAIREGVMPALKAARTAFTCPRVNESATASGCHLGEGLEGLSVGEDRLPLRFASASATASSRSSSSSSRCLTALGRSLGRTCRRCCTDEAPFVAGGVVSPNGAVENRSGDACRVRSRPMAGIIHYRGRGSNALLPVPVR